MTAASKRISRLAVGAGPLSAVHEHVGRQVAEFRAGRGWSLSEMAEALGFGRATVADVEGGRQDLWLSRVIRIAELLDVPVESLVQVPPGWQGSAGQV